MDTTACGKPLGFDSGIEVVLCGRPSCEVCYPRRWYGYTSNHKVCNCVVTCGVAKSSEHEPRVTYCPLHASAPGLLAALDEIIRIRLEVHENQDDVVDVARAAIHKAKGL